MYTSHVTGGHWFPHKGSGQVQGLKTGTGFSPPRELRTKRHAGAPTPNTLKRLKQCERAQFDAGLGSKRSPAGGSVGLAECHEMQAADVEMTQVQQGSPPAPRT